MTKGLIALLLAACDPAPAPVVEAATLCDEASEQFGSLACVHEVPDWGTWGAIQRSSDAIDKIGETKWLAPARDDARLDALMVLAMPTVQLHWQLMGTGFPDRFPNMTHAEYSRLVLDPEVKEFYSGNLTAYEDGGFGFTLWSGADPALYITEDSITSLWTLLQSRFGLGDLAFVPNSQLQRDAIATWGPVPFRIRGDEAGVAYEAYTPGVGFGTVRHYTPAALAQAEDDAAFGHTDVLALDEAPFDIERPVAAAITGTRQGDLSHLNVRSAARGTPNCYVADPATVFAPWEGELVRVECGLDRLDIRAATLEEAEGYWESIRPEPLDIPLPDLSPHPLMPLLDLPTADASERLDAVRAYGSKGANLGTLYQRIDADLQLDGFLVPMALFAEHLEAHGLDGEAARIETDPVLQADSAARRDALEALQDAIELAPVDPVWVTAIAAQIEDTFGSPDVMVRFRSSSNAEDALGFSGAGLYDSTSVCVADSLDADAIGPSLCDPDEPDERTIERGLRKVWAGTFRTQAWEERAWFGIPATDVAMGVLVDTRAKDELVNAVAFTGNPVRDDDRQLIDAQVGWLDVVSAEAGVVPEQILATVDGDEVLLERVRLSSEAPLVLDDPTATALALALAHIEAVFPVDGSVPSDRDLLLDTEWKVLSDGRLIIKQVRPFLRSDLALP